MAGLAGAGGTEQPQAAEVQIVHPPGKTRVTAPRKGKHVDKRRRSPIPKKQATKTTPTGRLARPGGAEQEDTNTWLIFGFTEGSDVGQKGERTIFHESIIRGGGRVAGFSAWDGGTGLGYSVSDRAVISLGAIASTEGSALEFERGLGVVAGFKYQFLRRDESPVGLAAQISPYAQRFESSAAGHNAFGAEFRLIADRTLIPDRWFAALNLIYVPQHNAYTDGSVVREAIVEVSGAVSHRLSGDLFVGAELRHLNKFHGYGVDRLAGSALYFGPTLFLGIGENGYLGAAWSVQLAGRSNVDAVPRLDLESFERQQFRLKAGISF